MKDFVRDDQALIGGFLQLLQLGTADFLDSKDKPGLEQAHEYYQMTCLW